MNRLLSGILLVHGFVASAAAQEPIALFNGVDLDGWKVKGSPKSSRWSVQPFTIDGVTVPTLTNAGVGLDIYSEKTFADCVIECDFLIPKGSNSGLYVMGEYEIQIIDSFGKKKNNATEMGAVYNLLVPRVNASRPAGDWQKIVIDFTAPRFQDGKKIANARFNKVILNGELIHENAEVAKVTSLGSLGKEGESGPVLIQGTHGPIAIRTLQVTPRSGK